MLVLEQGSPHAVLTGDSLFIGGVGRPDLVVSDGSTSQSLAEAIYRTPHTVLLPLSDGTRGWRSSVAASLLRSQGHTDVTDLVGGYAAWAEQAPTRV